MLDHQPLHHVFTTYQHALNHPVRTFTIGGRLFDFNRYRYLVGVAQGCFCDTYVQDQPQARAPIDAGKLVADNGKVGDYRY